MIRRVDQHENDWRPSLKKELADRLCDFIESPGLPAYAVKVLSGIELSAKINKIDLPKKTLVRAHARLVQSSRYRMLADVPPPEERLCKLHGIAISESRWRSGHRHSDCARCRNHHASKERNTRLRALNRTLQRVERYGKPNSFDPLRIFERTTGMKMPAVREASGNSSSGRVSAASVYEQIMGGAL
jgi:hypothetical protein